MTLKDWCNRNGLHHTHPTTESGAVSVLVDLKVATVNQLWCLDDFVVSSRSGPVVWLVPKAREEVPCA